MTHGICSTSVLSLVPAYYPTTLAVILFFSTPNVVDQPRHVGISKQTQNIFRITTSFRDRSAFRLWDVKMLMKLRNETSCWLPKMAVHVTVQRSATRWSFVLASISLNYITVGNFGLKLLTDFVGHFRKKNKTDLGKEACNVNVA